MLLKRKHVPKEEVFLIEEEHQDDVPELKASVYERARIRHEVLQKEIDLLRARLHIIRDQAGLVAKSGVTWANASARAQLGPYPWAKFAALAASSFLVTRGLRKLPMGEVAGMTAPLLFGVLKNRNKG